ncbi:MAG: fluoride efflux transporter CrcB [Cyclobacteriaceae bacterium]
MKQLLLVGIGGFSGSILRYLMGLYSVKLLDSSFPYGTLSVNLIGSLLIGLLAGSLIKTESQSLQLLMITGFCGGFTTFSAFSLEGLKMIKEAQYFHYAGYIGISILGGLLLCLIGFWLAQKAFA